MKYFTIAELCASDKAKQLGINNHPSGEIADRMVELVEQALDPIRELFGSAIRVTSGYRCKAVNEKIKGSSPTSAHVTGWAADTQPVNANMAHYQRTVLRWAKDNKFDQIIIEYPDSYGTAKWIHIGLRNATGMQRGQILYTTNGRDYLTVSPYSKFYLV